MCASNFSSGNVFNTLLLLIHSLQQLTHALYTQGAPGQTNLYGSAMPSISGKGWKSARTAAVLNYLSSSYNSRWDMFVVVICETYWECIGWLKRDGGETNLCYTWWFHFTGKFTRAWVLSEIKVTQPAHFNKCYHTQWIPLRDYSENCLAWDPELL